MACAAKGVGEASSTEVEAWWGEVEPPELGAEVPWGRAAPWGGFWGAQRTPAAPASGPGQQAGGHAAGESWVFGSARGASQKG